MITTEQYDGAHKRTETPLCICGTVMEVDHDQPPWAETDKFVVIPLTCPKCGYESRFELTLE